MAKTNIADLNIKISGSSKDLTSEVNKAQRTLRELRESAKANASAMGTLRNSILGAGSALLAYRAAAAVKDFAFDGVKLASDLETATLQFEVMFQSAAKAQTLIAEVYKLAEQTPFQSAELIAGAKQLTAYGFAADEIRPVLTALGDIAAGTGADIGDLAQIFGRARNEGRLMGDDINRLTDRAVPVLDLFAEQLGVGVDQVRKLASEGKITFPQLAKAISTLTDEGGRFDGMMQRLSATTAGQFSTLKDEVDALKREFGQGLLPTLTEALGVLREFVTGGSQAKTTLEGFRETGQLAGQAMRILAGSIQLARGELAFLVQLATEFANLTPRLFDAIAGTDISAPLRYAAEDLDRQTRDLIDSGKRLLDLSQSLSTPPESIISDSDEKSLTDILDRFGSTDITPLTDDVKEAADEFKALGTAAKTTADTIRRQYRTPLEDFKDNIREIIDARDFGGLDFGTARRALQDEIDKVTLKLTPELEESNTQLRQKGSIEDLKSQIDVELRKINAPKAKEQKEQIERVVREVETEVRTIQPAQNVTNNSTTNITEVSPPGSPRQQAPQTTLALAAADFQAGVDRIVRAIEAAKCCDSKPQVIEQRETLERVIKEQREVAPEVQQQRETITNIVKESAPEVQQQRETIERVIQEQRDVAPEVQEQRETLTNIVKESAPEVQQQRETIERVIQEQREVVPPKFSIEDIQAQRDAERESTVKPRETNQEKFDRVRAELQQTFAAMDEALANAKIARETPYQEPKAANDQLERLREIAAERPADDDRSIEQVAKDVLSQFREERSEARERGEDVAPQAPQLYQQLVDAIRSTLDTAPQGTPEGSRNPLADPPIPLSDKMAADAVKSLGVTMAQQSAMDRAILISVQAALEKIERKTQPATTQTVRA
jgi:tape measure domain-containing protein